MKASSTPVGQVVGVMAFGQSLLFLLFWLLVCFSAGAGTTPPAKAKPALQVSTYDPANLRDPFLAPGVTPMKSKVVDKTSLTFKLQGILYSPSRPAAMVNDKLVEVGKPVTLTSGLAEIEVSAVRITRDTVILEAAGERIELRLAQVPSTRSPTETTPADERAETGP